MTTSSPSPGVVACVKWVDLRPEVDSLTGHVHHDERHFGWSPADESAVGLALSLGEAWAMPVTVVCAGPAGADVALRDLLARRVTRVIRIAVDHETSSAAVAAELAATVMGGLDGTLLICGDHSLDRGSGSVPAFLAHRLGCAQALGLSEVTVGSAPFTLRALRRLGGGRKERLEITAPAVISVEAGIGVLPRAALAAAMESRSAPVEVQPARHAGGRIDGRVQHTDHRPVPAPARVLAAPAATAAFDRVLELTGALVERTPPQRLELEPAAAALAILDAVRSWTSEG